MFALNEVSTGSSCMIVWMIGKLGSWVKEMMQVDLDDTLKVIRNYGEHGGMIVEANGNRYALSADAAFAIKVYLQ